MKQVNALQCEGCGELFSEQAAKYHDEAKCLAEKAEANRQQAEWQAKVEAARVTCRQLGLQYADELREEHARGEDGMGFEYVRDLAHEIYYGADLPNMGCSSGMESMYNLIIQAAIPDYVYNG